MKQPINLTFDTARGTVVFTDGSSRGNPGPGGWGSVIVDTDQGTVHELGGYRTQTTNNRMEMMAIISSLIWLEGSAEVGTINVQSKLSSQKSITVYTDSAYVVNHVSFINTWRQNNWKTKSKTEVKNQDLWEQLDACNLKQVQFVRVPGHSNVVGNERADIIATEFADAQSEKNNAVSEKLFSGLLADYRHDVLTVDLKTAIAEKNKRNQQSKKSTGRIGKAFSYVSEVNGQVEVHTSWSDCESRVKGVNARFKKALSSAEEKNLITQFSKPR